MQNNFTRLIKEILSYKKNAFIIILTVITTSIIAMIGPYLIGIGTDSIIGRKIYALIIIGSLYLFLYVVNYFAANKRTKYTMNTSQEVIKQLRSRAFKNLQYVPFAFYSERSSGRIISRITNDAETLSEFLTFQVPQVAAGIMGIIASLIIMLYLDYMLALYAILIIPLLLLTIFTMNRKIKFNFINVRRRIAELTGNVGESINGIKAIKTTGSESRFINSFRTVNSNNYQANVRAVRLTSIFSSIVEIIEGLGIALVLYEGAIQVFSGIITIGIVVAFIVYVQSFFTPIVQLSQFYNSYQASSIAVSRIYELIDEKSESNKYVYDHITFNDKLTFSSVDFSYSKKNVISNLNFEIKKGEKIALIGKTGAGKTTITNLMLKLYYPNHGHIYMDNIDINDIRTSSYRKLFGVILQEPLLFEGTIMENIKFYNYEITEEMIKNKISEMNLNEIFNNIDLNSQSGERGSNLSEGQRQSISILRAVITDPDIIIMDEATSQLDYINENNIQNAIRDLMKNKTIIVIAHHIRTILNMDRIFYIDNGKIIEEGAPLSLIKNGGYFYDLYMKNRSLL